jgi:hypothetical protein
MYEKANLKTHSLMIQASKKSNESILIEYMLKDFPHEDLMIIDRLWHYYSDGRFSLSIQKEIFEFILQKNTSNQEAWRQFFEQVGWSFNNKWFKYTELNFVDCTILGHLPALGHISSLETPDHYWVVTLQYWLFSRL